MNYKNMSDRDRNDFIMEVKNSSTEILKSWLAYIKLFKSNNIILSDNELEIQKDYKKIIIGELVSRGKKG